jgi:hypothetical protein
VRGAKELKKGKVRAKKVIRAQKTSQKARDRIEKVKISS